MLFRASFSCCSILGILLVQSICRSHPQTRMTRLGNGQAKTGCSLPKQKVQFQDHSLVGTILIGVGQANRHHQYALWMSIGRQSSEGNGWGLPLRPHLRKIFNMAWFQVVAYAFNRSKMTTMRCCWRKAYHTAITNATKCCHWPYSRGTTLYIREQLVCPIKDQLTILAIILQRQLYALVTPSDNSPSDCRHTWTHLCTGNHDHRVLRRHPNCSW